MSDDETADGSREVPPPGILVPGVRTALEMALVALIIALVGLPADDAISRGIVLLAALVAMVVVLFWALNKQMAEWIKRAQGRPTIRSDRDGWL